MEEEPIRGGDQRKHGGPGAPCTCQLRIGSVNMGTMSRRSGEVADMVARRRLDFFVYSKRDGKERVLDF